MLLLNLIAVIFWKNLIMYLKAAEFTELKNRMELHSSVNEKFRMVRKKYFFTTKAMAYFHNHVYYRRASSAQLHV